MAVQLTKPSGFISSLEGGIMYFMPKKPAFIPTKLPALPLKPIPVIRPMPAAVIPPLRPGVAKNLRVKLSRPIPGAKRGRK